MYVKVNYPSYRARGRGDEGKDVRRITSSTKNFLYSKGYALDKRATDDFEFITYNAGPASQSTISSVAYAAGSWMLIGVSRSGADVTICKNGDDITLTAGTHIDPGAVGPGTFYISDGSPAAVDGKIWRPRIWDRALSAAEWLHIFGVERHWFGV